MPAASPSGSSGRSGVQLWQGRPKDDRVGPWAETPSLIFGKVAVGLAGPGPDPPGPPWTPAALPRRQDRPGEEGAEGDPAPHEEPGQRPEEAQRADEQEPVQLGGPAAGKPGDGERVPASAQGGALGLGRGRASGAGAGAGLGASTEGGASGAGLRCRTQVRAVLSRAHSRPNPRRPRSARPSSCRRS